MKSSLIRAGWLPVFLISGALCLSAIQTGSSGDSGGDEATPPAAQDADRPYPAGAPPGSVLRRTTPQEAGLSPRPLQDLARRMEEWTNPSSRAGLLFPGASWLLASDGDVVARRSAGDAVRYGNGARELAPQQRERARPDTVYDLASLSKLFTSLVAVQQIEAGMIHLDDPVSRYLPGFSANGKGAVTVGQLLTHTSGLPPDPQPPLAQVRGGHQAQEKSVLGSRPVARAGTRYLYSDLNMLSMQLVLEKVTGRGLDALVREGITKPLGMRDTGYNPPAAERNRIAATSYEKGTRGLIRGSVHDSNAHAFGGVAGHAGVFSTVDDLAVLAQTLLNGGSYRGHRVLDRRGMELLQYNYNKRFPRDAHGLGFELDQEWYMGPLASTHTLGHTGFTGTSLVVDRSSCSFAILLTNRVHPRDETPSTNPARREIARALDEALPRRAPDRENEGPGRLAEPPGSAFDLQHLPRTSEKLPYAPGSTSSTPSTDSTGPTRSAPRCANASQ